MRYWLMLIISSLFFSSLFADRVFRWKDQRGRIHYGDLPPKAVMAKTVDLPELTIVKDYGKLYEPVVFEKQKRAIPKEKKSRYQSFSITAPKNKQAIRAPDGDITIMLSLSPKLLANDQITLFLDGKKVRKGRSRIMNLTHLKHGKHTLYGEVSKKTGQESVKSEVITFTIIR
ncbi:MAG: DUF4124 domain-containing protein [Cocleimonas sp.]|nr:DUF4124 domain-containing protein [Cocleimonas sp.]